VRGNVLDRVINRLNLLGLRMQSKVKHKQQNKLHFLCSCH
jgi:hypothetical protein